jgi:hypothetical protein
MILEIANPVHHTTVANDDVNGHVSENRGTCFPFTHFLAPIVVLFSPPYDSWDASKAVAKGAEVLSRLQTAVL